jgi:hypothetical protein
MEGFVGTG